MRLTLALMMGFFMGFANSAAPKDELLRLNTLQVDSKPYPYA